MVQFSITNSTPEASVTVSQELPAYAAKLAASVGIDRSMLAETIDALVKNVCQTEDTAGCVEEVLQELKK